MVMGRVMSGVSDLAIAVMSAVVWLRVVGGVVCVCLRMMSTIVLTMCEQGWFSSVRASAGLSLPVWWVGRRLGDVLFSLLQGVSVVLGVRELLADKSQLE